MVLHPIVEHELPSGPGFVPAWSAVERRQGLPAAAWRLVRQAEHAALSGKIAGLFATPGFPRPPAEIVEAIAIHDAGWEIFEAAGGIALRQDGRPLAFHEVAPPDFLRAWSASIAGAASRSDAGGYIVSRHFASLAQFRLERGADPPDIRGELRDFAAEEGRRQAAFGASAKEWDTYVPLLQFCDILSLYLCCGTREAVQFPQEFACGQVRAHFEGDTATLSPSPLARPVELAAPAREYPSGAAASIQIRLR